ncbi:VOC family protein [Thermoleptolyngbya sp. C42_A2020_037]|uniref:SMU1112c/YaeR family gloxylase I-like metalloprotein n=1 Tax=Thermoleptolyngbya sp. C42_A2020_037 TaxID=2747799 RepID=UPI001A0E41DD|nr:VOC family protein [Thermoleptolyngbya sp. C42_A2020_037]MBF2085263.1 VOC family protein [Thermoleptolyngbya sp. C42_A2020_037]
MQLSGFHHIALICSDYERSKRFYTEILGFQILQETYRAARQSYKLDLALPAKSGISAYRIELFSFPAPPPRPSRPEACGLRHLAFATPDLDRSVVYLGSQGISVEPIRVDELTQKRFTFFQDPDGLPLELYEA